MQIKCRVSDLSDLFQVQLLDVACLASIRKFASSWQAQKRPLHILVNNAGVFTMGGKILLFCSLASDSYCQRPAD